MWGSRNNLAFIWSHKTKELPLTSRPPAAELMVDGLLGKACTVEKTQPYTNKLKR